MPRRWKELWQRFSRAESMLTRIQDDTNAGHLPINSQKSSDRERSRSVTHEFAPFFENLSHSLFARDILSYLAKPGHKIKELLHDYDHFAIMAQRFLERELSGCEP